MTRKCRVCRMSNWHSTVPCTCATDRLQRRDHGHRTACSSSFNSPYKAGEVLHKALIESVRAVTSR